MRAHLARRVRDFLKREAKQDLDAASRHYAALLGVTLKRIAIRDQVSRWGSCTSAGVLSYSWRLILTPPHVLDYLAAHEVAHLLEMNHSRAFWRVVARICPGLGTRQGLARRQRQCAAPVWVGLPFCRPREGGDPSTPADVIGAMRHAGAQIARPVARFDRTACVHGSPPSRGRPQTLRPIAAARSPRPSRCRRPRRSPARSSRRTRLPRAAMR